MLFPILASWLLLAMTSLVTRSFALPTFPALFRRATSYSSSPIPPSQDPWYTTPLDFSDYSPGAVLRLRSAPGNLTNVVGNCSAAYNILYRTTDSRYNASWAVTTLFVPEAEAAATNNNSALLSYQIAYDSADVNASPSYALYSSPSADISIALGQGWYVNVPDYEGPLAAFTAGVQSGHATLDSVRAVLNTGFDLSPSVRYALWGYSGGALASEWAAELQVQYAPELTFSGAALGGLTPNVTSVMNSVTGTAFAGLIPASLLGILTQYPESQTTLQSLLKTSGPYNKTTFLSAYNMTLDQSSETFAGQTIADYFVDGEADLNTTMEQVVVNNDGLMGYHGVPQMPLFVYKAIADEVSNITDTDALVAKYCEVGASILYQRNTRGGHAVEAENSDAAVLFWLSNVFNGVTVPPGCTIMNVTRNVTSSTE